MCITCAQEDATVSTRGSAQIAGPCSHPASASSDAAVEYDDGEAEWLDLAREQFHVVQGAKKAAKKPAGRRAAVLLSDDEEEDEQEEEADDSGSEYGGWLIAVVSDVCAEVRQPPQQYGSLGPPGQLVPSRSARQQGALLQVMPVCCASCLGYSMHIMLLMFW